jgi:hypothetical protein
VAQLATGSAWPDLEVIVVDCSLDGFEVPAADRVVRGPRLARPAAMATAGAKAATGDTLVFVDEWTVPAAGDDWLALLLAQLDDPWVAAAGALVVDPDGRVRTGGWWIDPASGPSPVVRVGSVTDSDPDGALVVPTSVTALAGPGLAIRRDRWCALGGADSELPGLLHDVELCLRAQVGGSRIVLDPRSRLLHHGLPVYRWPWDASIRERLAAVAPGIPDSIHAHAHPLLDPVRPGYLRAVDPR